MVLETERGSPGLRFIIGICIIAVSIYVFYIALAKKNAPELFLIPVKINTQNYPCNIVRNETIIACIPSSMDYTNNSDELLFYSVESRIRGNIRAITGLPREDAWRDSLRNPFTKTFLGDIDSMDTYQLIKTILQFKWNPTLMGPKAKLIPTWMRSRNDAAFLIPEGSRSIIFYTEERCLGLLFTDQKILTLSIIGHMQKVQVASFMRSITLP
ncbi:MAG: hypothetical protein JW920_11765 [Deltaproteobacteria bacterium]|nr:hypothetical protein [Deltaproteobacteria bacterium]